MRGTLDHLHFDVVKYEPHPDNRESKVYLGKKLGREVLDTHRSMRTVVTVGERGRPRLRASGSWLWSLLGRAGRRLWPC